MPRHARLDAEGTLHHIIVRGIERRLIFRDDTDKDRFAERMGKVFTDTRTSCYAWALDLPPKNCTPHNVSFLAK